jgi:hypothetical protein
LPSAAAGSMPRARSFSSTRARFARTNAKSIISGILASCNGKTEFAVVGQGIAISLGRMNFDDREAENGDGSAR